MTQLPREHKHDPARDSRREKPTGHHGHHGHHGHDHHGHDHGRGASSRRLAITLVLVLVFMGAEVIGGVVSGSLALLADAGHMLSDAAALALALFAIRLASKPPTAKRTYGYHRAEILAALLNGATLVVVAVLVVVEAWERIQAPQPVRGGMLLAVAAGGLLINIVGLMILHGGRNESLNVRGAWLHVASDALGSVQAMIAGLLIWLYDWRWVDPVVSILIALLVAWSAWSLLRASVDVLMESTPGHLDLDAIRATILALDGVTEVHDLHVWTITSGKDALSAHVCMTEGRYPRLLRDIRDTLRTAFGIDHATIQLEPPNFEGDQCVCSCAHVEAKAS
jgi:cobalt-zinc-cadmium efflux system protein